MKISSSLSVALLVLSLRCLNAHSKTVCSTTEDDPLSGYIDDDVIVEEGKSCFLTEATVTGKVTMKDGSAELWIIESTVKEVDLGDHGVEYVYLEEATVEKDIKGKDIVSMQIGSSTVGKDVDLTLNEGDGLEIDDSEIGGKIKVKDSNGVTVSINSNILHDDVSIEKCALTYISFYENVMSHHNVKIKENDLLGGEEGLFGQTQVVTNQGVKELEMKKNQIVSPTFIFENNVSKKIVLDDNTWEDGMQIHANFAGDEIKIEKNEGDTLECYDNIEASGSDSVSAKKNVIGAYGALDTQCEP